MDDRRVADYFVVAGCPENPEALDETILSEGGNLKSGHNQAPITDISVIFPSLGEIKPEDYEIITKTPTGLSADLNHGSLRTVECYLCLRRGRDKPPLVDIGVMYEGKEWLMEDAEVVSKSVGGNVANVNNSSSQTFITFRRGQATMPCNALVVTDVCVVIASKGESPPHAFCCINKNLNKGIVGSDVFLCYKKSMNRAKSLTYKPAVLSRYPMDDLTDFPFPNSVALFCLPMGASLEIWPVEAKQPKPVFSTFVLTVSDAKYKVYGSAVTFYERFVDEKLTDGQKELLEYEKDDSRHRLYINKSICLLSHWPFSDDFEIWLRWLHKQATSGEPQIVPIEKYIIQLLDEVPFPSPRILLQMSTNSDRVILVQPEDLPLPRSCASFKHLLLNLGSENCLQILLLMLTEQKILIHSLRPDTLTAVAEAVSTMMFPFKWQCPYIPLCPLGLVEILHAPLPFLIGVDSRFFDLYDPPPDVNCIDLDTNIITIAESQRQQLNIKLLPKRSAKMLKASLDYLYHQIRNTPVKNNTQNVSGQDIEMEFQKQRKENSLELEIQESFLKFMILTLKGYRNFLLPITKAPTVGTTDPQALFQLNDFLKSRDKAHHKFFTMLMKTQMFIRFIEERSFVTDGDHGLAFFDDCMEKLTNEESFNLRLIELDVVQRSDRTVFVLPPEPTGDLHEYDDFILDTELLKQFSRNLNRLCFNQSLIPGSPMARRTKQEIKSAQKVARKCQRSPDLWALCLCGTCHTLYFMILPSLLNLNVGREQAILQEAYELLVRATRLKLVCDEVCYRLMMQLCAEHSRPLLAVKLLVFMKKFGIQPNALTYGLYNRCVLEAEWPAYSGSSQILWNKLRNVIIGAAHFKWAIKRRASKSFSASLEGASSLLDHSDYVTSRSSLDSHEAVKEDHSIFDKFCKVASIVKGSLNSIDQADGNIDTHELEDTLNGSTNATDVNSSFKPPSSPSEYRLLTRSESAGDANIIDKLQGNIMIGTKALNLFNNSPDPEKTTKVSPLEPVTKDDPLGAFEEPVEPSLLRNMLPAEIDTPERVFSDDPILFRNSVQRSVTFEADTPTQGRLLRSETVPAAIVASGLASLGNSFKLGFSRYSPSRLSLRKADLKVPQLLIENAINNLSPASLTAKKSNEIFQGGLSSIKSAASSVVKRMEEIKEAISISSTNTTPIKGINDRVSNLSCDVTQQEDCESNDGSEAGERQRKVSAELFKSGSNSWPNLKDYEEVLPENLYCAPCEDKMDCELNINLTTCSQCHNCSCLLYDEDIMANWSSEDSNLNTLCISCNKPTVPFLTVTVKKKYSKPPEPFSVPYLNPLVLRKELENVITQEGDLCLSESQFVEDHPILYWNLVWIFERIVVPTHLPSLFIRSKTDMISITMPEANLSTEEENEERLSSTTNLLMEPVAEGSDPLTQELTTLAQQAVEVCIRCYWDEPCLHPCGPPMYILWKLRDTANNTKTDCRKLITKSFMQKIINQIRVNDLAEPLKNLANERTSINVKYTSIYRDILFLACKAVGRAHIDINAFDKEYANAYARVIEGQYKLSIQDKPISLNALYCRQYFCPLILP